VVGVACGGGHGVWRHGDGDVLAVVVVAGVVVVSSLSPCHGVVVVACSGVVIK